MRKFFLILSLFVFFFLQGSGQEKPHPATKHYHDPKAPELDKLALSKIPMAGDNPDSIAVIGKLLDKAVKLDSYYYAGWVNKLSFECHYDKFQDALKTVRRMLQIFKDQPDVLFYAGLVEFKTGHKSEAMDHFNRLLKIYNEMLTKAHKPEEIKGLRFNKGLALIMLDNEMMGRKMLRDIHDAESDPMVKSNLAFYINSSKNDIINDRLPGK